MADGKSSRRRAATTEEVDEPTVLCPDQERVVDMVVDKGASVFISGMAGSGKTFVLERIIRMLKSKHGNKHVCVTASTGAAATAIKGQTFHAFAGIGLGTTSYESLARMARSGSSRVQWEQCQVLVVDEIGMLDGAFFAKVEKVARSVRNNDLPFGGIQLVVVGDLFQLSPVSGTWVFLSDAWNLCIDATVELSRNHRQGEGTKLTQVLGRVRRAATTPFDTTYLSCDLNRPIREDMLVDQKTGLNVVATSFFATNQQADQENEKQLQTLPGPTVQYEALDFVRADSKRDNVFAHTLAVSKLRLRRGAHVMLIKNINEKDGLANGTTGVVVAFNRDWDNAPMVQIKGKKHPVTITAEEFEVPDGRRLQVPLRLSWAITIHKAQGLTLDCANVDLSKVSAPGQAYVALSRVRTEEGLRVVNFSDAAIRADKRVVEFMAKSGREKWDGALRRSMVVGGGAGDKDEEGWTKAKKSRTVKNRPAKDGSDSDDDFR